MQIWEYVKENIQLDEKLYQKYVEVDLKWASIIKRLIWG